MKGRRRSSNNMKLRHIFTVLSLRKSRAQCAYKRMQIIALGENTH